MSLNRIPTDSADAREIREAEVERQAEELEARRRHDAECVGGWLGDPDADRPRPCPRCRPWVVAAPCRVCGVVESLCSRQLGAGRGACCGSCEHPGGSA